eukprot:14507513-Heterocapsa_arctica.AAC.1
MISIVRRVAQGRVSAYTFEACSQHADCGTPRTRAWFGSSAAKAPVFCLAAGSELYLEASL